MLKSYLISIGKGVTTGDEEENNKLMFNSSILISGCASVTGSAAVITASTSIIRARSNRLL